MWAASIVFMVCLGVGLAHGPKPFYFDSGNYWALADTFSSGGHFSLFNFEYTGLRGFSTPLLYFVWSRGVGGVIGDAGRQVVVFDSVLFALIATVLTPRIASAIWPDQADWGLLRRFAIGALFIVFWGGYLNFPLSDFPALAAALLAILCSSYQAAPAAFLAGLAASFATNARPAYLLLLPLLFGIVVWSAAGGLPLRRMMRWPQVAYPLLFLVGVAVIALPQGLIAHRSVDGFMPIPGQ